jgi:hypothetical protein
MQFGPAQHGERSSLKSLLKGRIGLLVTLSLLPNDLLSLAQETVPGRGAAENCVNYREANKMGGNCMLDVELTSSESQKLTCPIVNQLSLRCSYLRGEAIPTPCRSGRTVRYRTLMFAGNLTGVLCPSSESTYSLGDMMNDTERMR